VTAGVLAPLVEARVRVPPRYIWTPPRASTAAFEVVGFMEQMGRSPDGEQRLALDCLLSEKDDVTWAGYSAAICEARQNGKTAAVMLPAAMADVWLFGVETALWTAHQQSTSDKTFEDMKQLVAANAWLSRRVRAITSGNGNHTVTLITGASLTFMTRTAVAGRGFDDVEAITLDEAQELNQAHLGALLPTTGVGQWPQIRYAGSAGHAKSHVWRSIRDRGRRGAENPEQGDPTLAYIEWAARQVACRFDDCSHRPGVPGCQMDNPERWQEANHSMQSVLVPDGRNQPETIEAFRTSMTPQEFGREILTWWDEAAGGSALKTDQWRALAVPADRPVELVPARAAKWFAVDSTPDLTMTAITMCVRMPSGRIRVEVIDHRPGYLWATAELARLKKAHRGRVLVVKNSPAGAGLIGDLVAAKVDPRMLTDQEYAAACSAFLAGTDPARPVIEHLGGQILESAISAAVMKDTGDGLKKWSRASSGDICALVAGTIGAWAVSTLPAPGGLFAFNANRG
jgi:hypothetical protein